MESGRRLFFNPSTRHGNMSFLGNSDAIFGGARTMISMEEASKKRPFFSLSEDLYDEYFDEQLSEKKRRLTQDQVHLLEKNFEAENKLESERKTQLAKKLGLQPRQVAVWFQNRRARWKTKQLERDYDLLKSSYDSLKSNYDSIVKENEKLKSEVASLTEKLQDKNVIIEAIRGQRAEPLPPGMVTSLQYSVKVEDRPSTGSAGSAVVGNEYPGCVGPFDGVQPEEDDGSDDGRSYFPNVFTVTEQEEQQHEEPLEWWVWS